MIVDRVGEFPGICFGNCLLFYFHLFIKLSITSMDMNLEATTVYEFMLTGIEISINDSSCLAISNYYDCKAFQNCFIVA